MDAQEEVGDDSEAPDAYAVAVGVPGYDVGGHADAGLVAYEAADAGRGTVASSFTQDSRGGPGEAEQGDRFGSVLALAYPAGGEDGLGLLVGAPQEDVGSAKDAGAVTYVEGLGSGSVSGSGVDQDTAGVPGVAEAGDRFGASLATTFDGNVTQVAVGVPGEDLGDTLDAGVVQRLSYDSDDITAEPSLSQDSPGVDDVAEAGDAFGPSVALTTDTDEHVVLVVGSPGEDGPATDTGLVQVFGPQPHTYTQDSLAVGDRPEAHDRFGGSLAALGGEADLLAVGVPDDAQRATGVVELIALDGRRPARHLVPGAGGGPLAGADGLGAALGTRHD